jgi:hypothetical protein
MSDYPSYEAPSGEIADTKYEFKLVEKAIKLNVYS